MEKIAGELVKLAKTLTADKEAALKTLMRKEFDNLDAVISRLERMLMADNGLSKEQRGFLNEVLHHCEEAQEPFRKLNQSMM